MAVYDWISAVINLGCISNFLLTLYDMYIVMFKDRQLIGYPMQRWRGAGSVNLGGQLVLGVPQLPGSAIYTAKIWGAYPLPSPIPPSLQYLMNPNVKVLHIFE